MKSTVATAPASISPEGKINLMNAIFGSGVRPVDFIDPNKSFCVTPGVVKTHKNARAAVRGTMDDRHWQDMTSRLYEISGDPEVAQSVLAGYARIEVQEQ